MSPAAPGARSSMSTARAPVSLGASTTPAGAGAGSSAKWCCGAQDGPVHGALTVTAPLRATVFPPAVTVSRTVQLPAAAGVKVVAAAAGAAKAPQPVGSTVHA